jgi:uncharacterized protein YbjT (DUF2867 family)
MRVILTGATGMVGEGVLLACLEHSAVSEVLSVSRRSCGRTHPKLKEVVTPDFLAMTELPGHERYDACFYCAGVSSVGKTEAEYTKATYDTPLHFAKLIAEPTMTLTHISGAGTDGTQKSKTMWARVKGRAENDLMKLPFKGVYNFRPGMMKPMPGQRSVNKYYFLVGWLYPVVRMFGSASTLAEVAQAMINTVETGYEKHVLEIEDINTLAARTH